MIVTKTLVWASTAATAGLVLLSGSTLLADGIQIETPYALAILTGSGVVIGTLFKLLISSKDREHATALREKDMLLKELVEARNNAEALNKSNREIAADAVKSATDMLNFFRSKEGLPPVLPLAAVLPESHSPSTPKQREAAELETIKATLAAVKLAAGLPPKEAPPQGNGPAQGSK